MSALGVCKRLVLAQMTDSTNLNIDTLWDMKSADVASMQLLQLSQETLGLGDDVGP